jgi:hypothetical protein
MWPGLPDFSWYKIPETVKNIPNNDKIYVPNGHKIYQIVLK